MGLKRLTHDGYGQLELNKVAFRRTGRIEAKSKIASGIKYVENGMILALNPTAKTVGMPTGTDEMLALNYSTEHMYDERANALKDFKLEPGTFLPRLGFLSVGDIFTTNCVCYDDSEEWSGEGDDVEAKVLAAVKAGTVYGVASEIGAIKLTKTKGTGLALVAEKVTTMPDGQVAIKFVVVAD